MIDAIGFFAGACMLGAILFRNIYIIKTLLLVAALSFMTYGIILRLPPIITVNAILAVTGLYELIRLTLKRRRAAQVSSSDDS